MDLPGLLDRGPGIRRGARGGAGLECLGKDGYFCHQFRDDLPGFVL